MRALKGKKVLAVEITKKAKKFVNREIEINHGDVPEELSKIIKTLRYIRFILFIRRFVLQK
jgi:hypothetical protein